ncbi:MAG: energy-coupled thiamine transporter ThiT [Eubacteriaceae bacterium]|nr:energy-coupled thiamine transporter ThiT [Eubacteriaceae bacterium]
MSAEKLQGFFESTAGQITVVAVIVIIFILILISGKNKKTDTKALVTCAVLTALAVALGAITLFRMPQGGSITPFSMVPIVLAGYFYGVRRGVMVGMVVGLINLIFNPYVIHPMQLLLDYPIAFGALGLGAIFRNREKIGLAAAYLFGLLCRYICAVLSGVIFFGAYAPEGFSALTWSLWYNLTYLAVEGAASVIILSIPVVHTTFDRLKLQTV